MNLSEQQIADCERLCTHKAIEHPGVKIEFGDPCGHIQKARVDYPWDLVVIDPRGDVRFSPWLPGTVGNIFERDLRTIWNEELADLHRRPEIASCLQRINGSNDMQEVGMALEATFGAFGGGRAGV
jgi:MoaA/NifB/PqqE/SkfB family radical SAM enzyme